MSGDEIFIVLLVGAFFGIIVYGAIQSRRQNPGTAEPLQPKQEDPTPTRRNGRE